jgi:hypothetical protein
LLAAAGYDLIEDLEDMTAAELAEAGLKEGHAKRIAKHFSQ